MLLVLQGWGGLLGLLGVAAAGAGLESLGASRPLAYALAGAALAGFGWWLNVADDARHRLSWIPVQYWGLAIAVGAIAGL